MRTTSGENDTPPTPLELAREILEALSGAYVAMQRETGDTLLGELCYRIGVANTLTIYLVHALSSAPAITAHEPTTIDQIDWGNP